MQLEPDCPCVSDAINTTRAAFYKWALSSLAHFSPLPCFNEKLTRSWRAVDESVLTHTEYLKLVSKAFICKGAHGIIALPNPADIFNVTHGFTGSYIAEKWIIRKPPWSRAVARGWPWVCDSGGVCCAWRCYVLVSSILLYTLRMTKVTLMDFKPFFPHGWIHMSPVGAAVVVDACVRG